MYAFVSNYSAMKLVISENTTLAGEGKLGLCGLYLFFREALRDSGCVAHLA